MTRFIVRGRGAHRLAAAALSAALLAGSAGVAIAPAYSQGTAAVEGVAPWQAKRAIEDYLNRFIVTQKRFAKAKFGSDEFSVRTKVENLTRVYNKDLGAIWVVQFSGAILPTKADENAEQGYAHALLKIYLDKDKGVQVVENEGQGVWTMTQKTSILYDDLPDDPGSWKEWGGPGNPPEPPNDIATSDPSTNQPYQPPIQGGSSGSGGDPRIQELAAKAAALGAKVAALKKKGPSPELQQAQEAWQAATLEYQAALPR